MIHPQFILDLNAELIVDNFAGGGGASTGIELALGRHVDIAINHDREALAMHAANHPQTVHLPEDIWAVDPVKVTNGRPVGLLWLSPDCKHFSKAKGGKPREKKIRGLALIGLNWVRSKRPRVLILENVEEFQTWGPLLKDGSLNPKCKGKTFQAYVGWLRRRGYVVEWRELRACDYGAPTIRKRLFLIARRDGVPITWPAATHGDPKATDFKASKLKPWRTAAECIDWSIPCPSIFTRKRPLAEATCRRIAKGIMRYVVNCAEPFIVPLTHQGESDRVTTMGQPLPTVTAAHRGELALVAPSLVVNTTSHPGAPVDDPLRTVCAGGGHHILVAPVLTEHANSTHERVFDPNEPLRTQCAQVKGGHFALIAPTLVGAGGPAYQGKPRDANQPAHTLTTENHSAVVTAFLAKHYTGVVGSALEKPMGTVTGTDHHSLISGCLVPRYGEREGQEPRCLDVKAPAPTVVPTGNGGSLVAAHLTKFRTGSTGSDLAEPIHTITAGPKENPAGAPHAMGLVAANIVRQFGASNAAAIDAPVGTVVAGGGGKTLLSATHISKLRGSPDSHAPGQSHDEPLHTVSAQGNHFAEVRAFLIKYYGSDQDPQLKEPMHTATSRDRFGLVTVAGEEFMITDIGLRMLAPRELFKAQGFPDSYIIGDNPAQGLTLTRSAQVRMCGNSVCPPLAAALVRANVPELRIERKAA
jgi:DNA (cytosine-5)-methyltransferase 1